MKMKKRNLKERITLDPIMTLLILIVLTIVVSGFLSLLGVQVTYNSISDSVTFNYTQSLVSVESLFSLSGLKYIFTTTVSNFVSFKPLSSLIIILIGIGVMEKSGFLKTVITLLTKKAKKKTVTFWLVFICVLSSIMGDLPFVVMIPLSALIFIYGHRNPYIGIIASFAALSAGSGISILLTSTDSALMDYTLLGAHALNANYTLGTGAFVFIMIVAVILVTLAITFITENIIAPKMPKYEFPEEEMEEEFTITKRQLRGLIIAGFAGLLYLLFFIYCIIPGLPLSGALLDYSQEFYIDKLFSVDSFFSTGFVFVVTMFFVILGFFYGIGAKTIKNNKEFVDALGHSLNGIGKILVMIFAVATFINIFKETNIGNVVAASLANLVNNSNFSGFPISILLFIVSIITSFVVPSPISGWSILSSTVPTLMQAGVSPEFAQLIFRFGNAVSIGLTPVFAYFIVYLAFLATYNQSSKPITLKAAVKYQLPFAGATLVLFLGIILVWYIVGMPLGVGTSVAP